MNKVSYFPNLLKVLVKSKIFYYKILSFKVLKKTAKSLTLLHMRVLSKLLVIHQLNVDK